jgi:hypothetical protein
MIDKRIREDIDLKLKKIEGSPQAYDKRKSLVIQDLRSMGDVYSFWIENPELRKSLLIGNKTPKTLRKMATEGVHNIHNGWYFLSQIGKYGGFVDNLDETVLKRLNWLVEPTCIKNERYNEFRKKDVTLNYRDYTPPSWEKVPNRISDTLSKIKEKYKSDQLEAAVLAHFELAAIQPFLQGNKRTARLIQDRILSDAGMPPASIQAGEATFYFNLLGDVLGNDAFHKKEERKPFYDYCASKVNNGLDEILGDLFEEPGIGTSISRL